MSIINKNKNCCKYFFNCNKSPKNNIQKKSKDISSTDINLILSNNKNLINNFLVSISPDTSSSQQNQDRRQSRVNIKKETNFVEETHFLHEFKDKIRCFFCGGKNCKHENYLTNSSASNAIKGLHSNYITPNIIASQRPSQYLITQFGLTQTFKVMNIGLIVNLQREGEHPYCGPNAYNLTATGYSYNPAIFTGNDIKCKLSGWKDMSVPSSMNFMLDIVKEMTVTVNDLHKKVLVHCHAGYGRTGIVIACYLLFNSEKKADEVIREIRVKRPKCVETKSQIHYCRKFEEFLNATRTLFDNKISIDIYLKRQEDLLCGNEVSKYGFVPRLITKTFEKCYTVKNKYNLDSETIYKLFIGGGSLNWNENLEKVLLALKQMINCGNWKLFDNTENLLIIVELLYDWFDDCVGFVVSPERTREIMEKNNIHTESDGINNIKIFVDDKELMNYIKKAYLCYEYETLYQIASFFVGNTPQSYNEESLFQLMLVRISIKLLGFGRLYKEIDIRQLLQIALEKEAIDYSFLCYHRDIIFMLTSIIYSIHSLLIDHRISDNDKVIIQPIRKSTITFMASQLSFIRSKDESPLSSKIHNKKINRVLTPKTPSSENELLQSFNKERKGLKINETPSFGITSTSNMIDSSLSNGIGANENDSFAFEKKYQRNKELRMLDQVDEEDVSQSFQSSSNNTPISSNAESNRSSQDAPISNSLGNNRENTNSQNDKTDKHKLNEMHVDERTKKVAKHFQSMIHRNNQGKDILINKNSSMLTFASFRRSICVPPSHYVSRQVIRNAFEKGKERSQYVVNAN